MRSFTDRIRHALSFEILGLMLIVPLGAIAFNIPITDIGVVGIVSATTATAWNYLYNLGFDHMLKRRRGTTQKSTRIRLAHALMFELGLLILLMPFIAWYLQINILHALVMDMAFAIFYVIYAFVFNYAYDAIFPLPEWKQDMAAK